MRMKVPSTDSGRTKEAMPRGLGSVPSSGNRSDYINDALDMYSKAVALAQPTTEDLSNRDLDRDTFNEMLDTLYDDASGDRIEAGKHAPKPIDKLPLYSAVPGALAGGALANGGIKNRLAGAAAGSLIGSGAGWLFNLNRSQNREDMLNTVRLLKEYGILKPELLKRTYPILRGQ